MSTEEVHNSSFKALHTLVKKQEEKEEEEEHRDGFESLDDFVVLQVFNRVGDIKTLGRCCLVSRRFRSLVPTTEEVTVKVDCVVSSEEGEGGVLDLKSEGGIFNLLFRLFSGTITKPWKTLQHLLLGSGFEPKKPFLSKEASQHSPCQVLKSFRSIKHLRIELPSGELGLDDGVLLKWKAEFGHTLENCIIMGASSLVKPSSSHCDTTCTNSEESLPLQDESDSGSLQEAFYTNGGLKLRVVWTISSLIAASARHYLLQQIIMEHPTLESLILTDLDGQGMLCMSEKQIVEFRNKPITTSASSNRTQVPALNVKLWYAPHLELSAGTALKGATLVSIRPSDHPLQKDADNTTLASAFEEPFKTAANLLLKRRTYLLEMNSF